MKKHEKRFQEVEDMYEPLHDVIKDIEDLRQRMFIIDEKKGLSNAECTKALNEVESLKKKLSLGGSN